MELHWESDSTTHWLHLGPPALHRTCVGFIEMAMNKDFHVAGVRNPTRSKAKLEDYPDNREWHLVYRKSEARSGFDVERLDYTGTAEEAQTMLIALWRMEGG